MSLHDDFIKKAYKEIDKLTADIEKKKSRIIQRYYPQTAE